MSDLDTDRHELSRHFFGARATFLKMKEKRVPELLLDDVREAAFQACADIGQFNRRHPRQAIAKVQE
jgi:hypothetical protein